MNRERVLNYIALPVLMLAVVLSQYWVWGLMFLWWLVPSVMGGEVNLISGIRRDEDPILFWAVAVLWAGFGIMMIAASLFPRYAPLLV